MTHELSSAVPTILFGAFDRHNFGDLLFPHIVAALLPEKNLVFAGLVERDLRCYGGHHVEALAHLAARWRDSPVNIVHAGGELLTCNAWEAAVMLLPPDEAQHMIALLDAYPEKAMQWGQGRLGLAALAPYTVQRALFPQSNSVIYNAVGGVDLDERAPAFREEVLANLRAADEVGVRDTLTQAQLAAAGIRTRLMPDPAVMVAELFGDDLCRRAGEVDDMRHAFPQGYIAVQFGANFSDDATLAAIAAQLDALAHATGFGIVFFRAGAAPWHDDIGCFERVAARMRSPSRVFTSLHLWDICALIASSHGYLGSSLHGRIIATAFALPRLNLVHFAQGERSKQGAYAETWDDAAASAVVQVQDIAQEMQGALDRDAQSRQRQARGLAEHYRSAFNAMCEGYFFFCDT